MKFRLKELRKQKNISQVKLAMDLNLSQNSISRYENGEQETDYETLIRFAEYFGVSPDELLGRSNTEAPKEKTAADLKTKHGIPK